MFLRLYEKDWVKKNISQLCYTTVELIDGWYTDTLMTLLRPKNQLVFIPLTLSFNDSLATISMWKMHFCTTSNVSLCTKGAGLTFFLGKAGVGKNTRHINMDYVSQHTQITTIICGFSCIYYNGWIRIFLVYLLSRLSSVMR